MRRASEHAPGETNLDDGTELFAGQIVDVDTQLAFFIVGHRLGVLFALEVEY